MERRDFIKKTGLGLAAAAGTAAIPAMAQTAATLPTIKWRLASSFPKNLDTLYGASEVLAQHVAAMTEGKFEIRVFAGGEIVPPNGVLDAVQQNTVECGHTCGYYYHGKNKAFSLDTTVPFGLNARQMNAWCYYGGGLALLREFFAKYNVVNFPGGNTGVQMGGWFRKEIKSLDDLKGLKIRIPGFGAEVFLALGAVPQLLPGPEIYPALERGAIDAAEWVGPYDDEKLGFYKVAKFYYYPAWWEPGPMISFYVNKEQWEKLPAAYQIAFETAAAEANVKMLANYDAKNPLAIQRLVQNGTQLRRYPDDALKAAYKAAHKIYAEESAKNPDFKKLFESMHTFQQASDIWMGLAEDTLANFMQVALRTKT
ncbi:twin-arginine translocation signal domain-containing protein [Candidatus Competibacter phosphatis]|uniref:Twin-arginine translocation signal domain-containing protein n=1 Tax=Candidatus Competibacter phosphatis TaxID=221280 RepID=A0ABX1TIT9_9GAMM|nr:TRAP transporter substrate-binding protein [Candidatus Competibacter phosphatis]NMQ18029.1 twin-arginine translocation signal domain-containing protein [Candidatus Competibacter phosphatis]